MKAISLLALGLLVILATSVRLDHAHEAGTSRPGQISSTQQPQYPKIKYQQQATTTSATVHPRAGFPAQPQYANQTHKPHPHPHPHTHPQTQWPSNQGNTQVKTTTQTQTYPAGQQTPFTNVKTAQSVSQQKTSTTPGGSKLQAQRNMGRQNRTSTVQTNRTQVGVTSRAGR